MFQMIFCTCPDRATATSIASALVDARLAACANLVPGVLSIYRWEGRVEQEEEVLLVIKARAAAFERVREAIETRHPYDVPEVLAVPVEAGNPDYLTWLEESTE